MSRSPIQKRKSSAEWKALLERYEQSGLSQRAFCLREGVSLSSFGRRHRAMLQDRDRAFIELPILDSASPAPVKKAPGLDHQESPWLLEVVLPDGSVLRFHG